MTVQVVQPPSGAASTPDGASATAQEALRTHDPFRLVRAALPWTVLGVLLAVLRYPALQLDNDDTWFHLAVGDRLRDGWSLTDPGALTRFATSDWVLTQWSSQLLMSVVDDWFGLAGVAWLFGALFALLALGVFAACRRWSRPWVAAVCAVLVVLGSQPALSARPQVVSLVLLVVTVSAWLRTAEDGRARWWLVPMTWAWATAHGLWSAGVLLGLVCWLGIVLDRRVDRRAALTLLAVPLLSLVATTLTPVGPRLLTSQLAVSARTSMIAEWGPTDFRTLPALVVAAMVAVVVVLWVRRGHVPWTHILLLLLAAGWTLTVTRMVALGAVVLAPLLAGAVERSLRGGPVPVRRTERAGLAGLAAAFLAVLAVVAPQVVDGPQGVPTGLQPRLEALPEGSAVLVEDGIGGWLAWQVPTVDPVIDGMLDAYPVDHIRDFFAMTDLEPGWQRFVADSGAEVAVVRRGSPLTAALRDQLGWREVEGDADWLLLERTPAAVSGKAPKRTNHPYPRLGRP